MHTKTLRDLGFKPVEEIDSAAQIAAVDAMVEQIMGLPVPRKLSRAQCRRLVARGVLPAFANFDKTTQVFDEMGNEWWANAEIDLKPFGFHDNLAELRATTKERRAHMN